MVKQWYYQNVQLVTVGCKNPDAKGLLSNLGMKTPLIKISKVPILGDILF